MSCSVELLGEQICDADCSCHTCVLISPSWGDNMIIWAQACQTLAFHVSVVQSLYSPNVCTSIYTAVLNQVDTEVQYRVYIIAMIYEQYPGTWCTVRMVPFGWWSWLRAATTQRCNSTCGRTMMSMIMVSMRHWKFLFETMKQRTVQKIITPRS